MSTKSAYLRSQDWVYEKDCVVCSRWPKAERANLRFAEGGYVSLPLKEPVCARCWAAFWEGICVVTETEEELEALRQAIREERRSGNPRPNAHELLKDIRARKAPTKH